MSTNNPESTAFGIAGGFRTLFRNVAIACLAYQPSALKQWEMKHFGRLILGQLFRLERSATAVVAAGPVGQRFRMRLNWQGHTAYTLGLYEQEMIQVLKHSLSRGDICVDLGAHVGYLSMIMARLVGPQGRVISFEPVPETCEALKENIRLNRFENVKIESAAAGDTEGSMELLCAKGQDLSWTASATGYSLPGEAKRISVPVVSLDRYLTLSGLRPRLLKIDVEGAELSVLRGACQTLREIAPIVLVEIHDLGQQHKSDVLQLLEGCGYAVTHLGRREREFLCLALPRKDSRIPFSKGSADEFVLTEVKNCFPSHQANSRKRE